MEWGRELQPAEEVEAIIKPKIQAPAEEQAAVTRQTAKKKKGPVVPFQALVDYRVQGRDLNLTRFFVATAALGVLFFAFSFWIRTPNEQIIHDSPHLHRRPVAPAKAADRSVRGYKVAY